MATLQEDIIRQSDWIIKAFESDGYKLDYSIHSFIEIDRFLEKNLIDGNPKLQTCLKVSLRADVFQLET